MKKYINIESTNNTIARVLSITDSNVSPNGLSYIEINNYIDMPQLDDIALDKAYPLYNKETQEFYWVVVNYQTTADEVNLELENTKYKSLRNQQKIEQLVNELNVANETINLLAETQADILGGAI